MRKRTTAILLTAAMTASMLAGCGGSQGDGSKEASGSGGKKGDSDTPVSYTHLTLPTILLV